MLKKYSILLILLLFAALTIIYFRNAIFASSSTFITTHLDTDLYAYFLRTWSQFGWLRNGFMPIGNYWVSYGGGFPATPVDQIVLPSNLLMVGLYAITHNLLTALRIFDPLIYFCTLVATYWYGTVLFKSRKLLSIVLAVAYTFSMYMVGEIEHWDLLSAPIFIALTLSFFELMLQNGKNKYIVLTGLFAFLAFLTDPYVVVFLAGFMALRLVWELIYNKERQRIVIDTAKAAIITIIASLPFLVVQLTQVPSQAVKIYDQYVLRAYTQIPGAYFVRGTTNSFTPEILPYLGLTVMVLALIPIMFNKTRKEYIFYLVATIFALLYAAGRYSPINFAAIIQSVLFFMRVPARSSMIGSLTLAICAVIGLGILIDKAKQNRLKYVIVGVAVVAIFCDLAIGYEPPTPQMALSDNAAYEWVMQQQGDFRVLEIPTIRLQSSMTSIYTGHDTLWWSELGYGYYEPLLSPATLYYKFEDETATAEQATEYAVKYIILDTVPSYYATLSVEIARANEDATANHETLASLEQTESVSTWLSKNADYKLVYNQNGWIIYQNLQYRGLVYGDGVIGYTSPNPNEIKIDVNSNSPTIAYISQSFDKNWKASIGVLSENASEQMLSLPKGVYTVTVKYTSYEKSLLWFLCYLPLLTIIILMLRKKK